MVTIKDLEKMSLSNDEVLQLIDGKANLVTYTQLKNYKNIDQLLGKYGACVILYLTKKNYGHWTCIFKINKKTLEIFDSYGIFPDDELNFKMNDNFRIVSGQNYPHLTYLLYNSPYDLTFNEYQFQKKGRDVATCGRHVATRLLLRKLSLENYKNLLTSDKYTPDEFVTMLTLKA